VDVQSKRLKISQHDQVEADGNSSSAVIPTVIQCREIRGLIESQCLSLRLHASALGLHQPKRIVAAGGASANWNILQVLADVFQAQVYTQQVKTVSSGADASAMMNTAALGAAYRAMWAIRTDEAADKSNTTLSSSSSSSSSSAASSSIAASVRLVLAASPRPELASVYAELAKRFVQLESKVVQLLA